MKRVFIDTSGFVAARDARDRDHQAARAALAAMVADRATLLTSNFVFGETFTMLLVRVSRDAAIRWGASIREGRAIEVLRVDEELEEAAWEILESHEDKRWSYVDATSFALMEREGIEQAFTFDRNFAQRGLRMLPG